MRRAWCGVLAAAILASAAGLAADEVVVVDVDGKETKLTGAKFGAGTRRLAWLADPKGATPDAKLGPLAVEVREPNSTTFAKGVVTLVPVAHLEAVRYDYEKLSAAFTVKGVKDPLSGTLQYKGINTIGVSGTADGKAAAFTAGALQAKGAVKTVTFPDAVPVTGPKAGGTNWAVQIVQPKAENPTVAARNLKVLYQFKDGTQHLADAVPARKGAAVPFDGKLTRFEMLANDENTNIAVAEVETGAGTEKVVAIPLAVEHDGKAGVVVGLVGEVEAGYKLFPLHAVKVIVPFSKKAD
ncbi:MAG: hypothetical protein C0501_21180 [Isosphaera sp.]|nr:hypothetical protein [Isosphaera sp.]